MLLKQDSNRYFIWAKSVVDGKITEKTVAGWLNLSDYREWESRYLEPVKSSKMLPLIFTSIEHLSKSKRWTILEIHMLNSELKYWNDQLDKAHDWFDDLYKTDPALMRDLNNPEVKNIAKAVIKAHEKIFEAADRMDIAKNRIAELNTEMNRLENHIMDSNSYTFLSIMGIL